MPDQHFEHPRLAALYDPLDPDRHDLDPYLDLADHLGARRVLDLGCGTGVLALQLADRGLDVIGVDPAEASLALARAKPGAERVQWIVGDATGATDWPDPVDLVTMTGNVAQAIVDPADWTATLRTVFAGLRPGGHLVFETRVPARRAWLEWNREQTHRVEDVPGAGRVETWVDLTDVSGPLVSFRGTYRFADGTVLTSDSTLRFRDVGEIDDDLHAIGYDIIDRREPPTVPAANTSTWLAARPDLCCTSR